MTAAPLVCLHGFTGTPQMFAGLEMSVFWAPFLSGHGPDPDFSSQSYFEEVNRIARGIESRCRRPIHLLGYSMGARLSLGLVERFPHLIERATLLGVNPGLETEQERQDRLAWEARWIDVLEQDGLAVFEHKWQNQDLFDSQKSLLPRSLESQKAARLCHSATGLVHAINVLGLGSMPNYWPRLKHFKMPVAVVYGSLDLKFGALAKRAFEANPLIKPTEIQNCGHNPLLESPEQVRRLLH